MIGRIQERVRGFAGRPRRRWALAVSLIALWPALLGAMPAVACQQEGDRQINRQTDHQTKATESSGVETLRAPAPESASRRETQISTLESIRRSLNETIRPGTTGNLLREELPAPRTDYWDLLSSELETSRQVENLGDRIRSLVKLNEERRQREMEEANRQQHAPAADAASGNVLTDTNATAAGEGQTESGSGENLAANSPAPSLATRTTRILSEPPDQLALADSLFFSGENELALDLYRKARGTGPSERDETWIQYQIASCLRRLGQTDEASKLFREIAETTGTDPVGAGARWWLDAIDRKQMLQNELETFRNFIETREATDATDQDVSRTDS